MSEYVPAGLAPHAPGAQSRLHINAESGTPVKHSENTPIKEWRDETRMLEWARWAWHELYPDCTPSLVEPVKANSKSIVYRMSGFGDPLRHASVIAKRGGLQTLRTESLVYREILPSLPTGWAACYGVVAENAGKAGWLFLEDCGEANAGKTFNGALVPVSRWMATLHGSASRLTAPSGLPPRNATYFSTVAAGCRGRIAKSLERMPAADEGRECLERIDRGLDALVQQWPRIHEVCDRVPSTLVHCDLRPKNVVERSGAPGSLFLIDWEYAGWGPPAIDLADLDPWPYFQTIVRWWPDIELSDIEQLRACGKIFCWLYAVDWELRRLERGNPGKSLRRLRIYSNRTVVFPTS